ncbi:MAG: hypothetical protein D6718_05490 [Acidobacteria bacterium]|nr:MAG: hypothetical protein D6718_05490 [Acidobacteriota bacterium]
MRGETLDAVLALARAEARLCRRLVRYWIFLALSVLLPLAMYLYHGLGLHRNLSSWSATAAMINPRFFIGSYGSNLLLVMLLGVIFLAFDVRARDRRDRIAEVLDARPVGNVALLAGRGLGLLGVSMVPVLLLAGMLLVVGWLIREPIEPVSLFGFALFMAVPATVFMVGATFLAAIALRARLLAALVTIALVVGSTMALLALPMYDQPLFDLTGGYAMSFPSDLMPEIAPAAGWFQRAAVAAAGIGALLLGAALHPRRDHGHRGRRAAAGLVLLAAAAGGLGMLRHERAAVPARIERWRAEHAKLEELPAADLRRVSGKVVIAPGRRVEEALELTFAAPPGEMLEEVLLTANPGLAVERVEGEGGPLPYTFASGLLRIRLGGPLAAGQERTIRVELAGRPDLDFAYLSAAAHPLERTTWNGAVFLLGYEPAIFDRRFVALMPGIAWLPMPGPFSDRGDPRRRPRDPFELDLTVEVPESWHVAGPGAPREAAAAGPGRRALRFAPGGPVPEVALVAAPFEALEAEIAGVRCRLLVASRHRSRLEPLAAGLPEIRRFAEERLRQASEEGLPYPYDGFTLVEVPNRLRGFGGGWRMDTVLAPPGMLLLRESGLPTARWDVPFSESRRSDYSEVEGGMPAAILSRLQAFFDNDFSGGNLFTGGARNFLPYLVSPRGEDAVALDYTLEVLTSELLFDRRGFFSVHLYDAGLNRLIGKTVQRWFMTGRSRPIGDVLVEVVTERPEIWETVLGVALSRLDPWEDPARTIDVLTLKGGALSRSLRDELGREALAATLAALRSAHEGGAVERDDLIRAARSAGRDLEPILATWLDETELPAFAAEESRLVRLEDDAEGNPRYQLIVRLRNDGSAPGLVRLSYVAGEKAERQATDPVRVEGRSAVEIGVVTSEPPKEIRVEPYLSRNRGPFAVAVARPERGEAVRAEPFTGARTVPWHPPAEGGIVVDDLDEGFGTVEPERRGWLRLRPRGRDDVERDAGLPVADGFRAAVWSRRADPAAWGRYRHTEAVVAARSPEYKARFTARLPQAGRWTLQVHLPGSVKGFPLVEGRRWSFRVEAGGRREEAPFDPAAAPAGWSDVGEFELAAGEAVVELSLAEGSGVLVADAIRWVPASAETAAGTR